MDEIYMHYFGDQFENDYKLVLNKIIDYVMTCKSSFSISKYELNFDDIDKRKEDRNYLGDKSISFRDSGIEILIALDQFWDDVKNYIPKTVTRLEIPCNYIDNDINFLESFPNLETLVISDYGKLSVEQLDIISEKTSIKEIIANNTYGIGEYYKEGNFSVIEYPYNYLVSDKLIYHGAKETDITEYLSHTIGGSIRINSYDLDKNLIERLYDIVDERLKSEIIIETNTSKYTVKFDEDRGNCQIKIDSDNISDVNKFYDYMFCKGIRVDKILWRMKNTNYYDMDISSLKDVSLKTELSINYGEPLDSSYEDFKGLLESVKWYRKIITDSELSPVEKVMFAFDIVKTFRYHESDASKSDSRYAHRIIKTGNIVCVGYSNLLVQILNYLDEGVNICEFGLSCYDEKNGCRGGHSRSLVKIDDDKYNIHGVFALDATWDSDKSHIIAPGFYDGYTSLDLYRYFLVPMNDYEKTFPGDTFPDLFGGYLGKDFNEYGLKSQYESLYKKEYKGDFFGRSNKNVNYKVLIPISGDNKDASIDKEMVDDELKEYLSVSKPSLEQFAEMLINVRIAQGYSRNDVTEEVNKVVKINQKVIQNMNSDGNEIEFFKEEKGVIK